MDIEEARRRLAAHPPHGDPTNVPGETLEEKAKRLGAEQGPCRHDDPSADTWFDRTICPEPCGGMHTRCADCGKALDCCPLERPAVEARTEWGARFEDGTTMLRPSRELAECTIRAIQGRHGEGQLMQRQVITTSWTEAEEAK